MNGYNQGSSCCYFHPKEDVIGVCPLCLNERLLLLASKQGQLSSSSTGGIHGIIQGFPLKKLPINKLPKIFALGSFLNRFEFKHWKSENSDDFEVSTWSSQEDSISIKFEENGVASWENGEVNSKVSIEHCSKPWNPNLTKELTKEPKVTNNSMIEHGKPCASLRWRKRIGHLFQIIKGDLQKGQCVPHGKQGKWDQLDGEGLDEHSDKEEQRIKSVVG
ncbi:putative Esterase precursor [Hibiscus syriacus]|uniref:Esterase n=1 Tax=Hibiscus syriacus TaxID=106335 RepID=A0A6A3CC41_HIBSY|nr:uncharacterized protein LOC120203071 [Hibiscus syriacus]KAE8725048.1 putative Esterase precursor [Hibiscus syriacus]